MEVETVNGSSPAPISPVDAIRTALARATSVPEILQLRDKAEAARQYMKARDYSHEAQNECAAMKIRCERRIGELLPDLVSRGNPQLQMSHHGTFATLPDIGLSRNQSSRFQSIATIPEDQFEAFLTEAEKSERELTSSMALMLARRLNHRQRKAHPFPTDKYTVIYADPPWSYDRSGDERYGHADVHYDTMSIEDICALPVGEIGEADSVLFLWVTSPLVFAAEAVFRAWGYSYKAMFVWDKVKHNYGHYNSVRHEILLVCGRGSSTPQVPELMDSVVVCERIHHSAKPELFRGIIDTLYPSGKRIEMFARGDLPGTWEAWGNECQNG